MTPRELKDQFREDVDDKKSPPFWSDETVYRFLNWSLDTVCMGWGGIADSTSPITQLKATANQEFTAISPRILKIKTVWSLTNNHLIDLVNIENLMRPAYVDDYGFQYRQLFDTTRPGPIRCMVTGMEPNKVRWANIPAADETFRLSVLRLPLCEISCSGEGTIEFGPEFREVILNGIKYMAYGQQDAEKFNAKARDKYKEAFDAGVAEVRRIRERREAHTRVVRYGGI